MHGARRQIDLRQDLFDATAETPAWIRIDRDLCRLSWTDSSHVVLKHLRYYPNLRKIGQGVEPR